MRIEKYILAVFSFMRAFNASPVSERAIYEIEFVPVYNNTIGEVSAYQLQEIITVATEKEAEYYDENIVLMKNSGTYMGPLTDLPVDNSTFINSGTLSGIYDGMVKSVKGKYEVEIRSPRFIKHPMIPISPCHDSTDGFGGSMGYSGSISVGTSEGIDLGLGAIVLNVINVGLSVSVSNTITISESISCSVQEGDIVQLFGEPWIVNTDYRYRKHYGRAKGNHLVSAWSKFENGNFPISAGPAPLCVTGVGRVLCGFPLGHIDLKDF